MAASIRVKCKVCGEPTIITLITKYDEVKHRGIKLRIPYIFKRCSECGSDFASASEVSYNINILNETIAQIDEELNR